MPRLIFIFLDGVGIGTATDGNPFFLARASRLPFYVDGGAWPDGTPIRAIDPLMGVSGLPQSASGQTSLFTGINVPRLVGGHLGSYPNQKMRELILRHNLLKTLQSRQRRIAFLNAYPVFSRFFQPPHLRIGTDGRFDFSGEFPETFKKRISVTTCMMLSCRFKPFDEHHLAHREAVYQDYSNLSLREHGLNIPEFRPEEAADIIGRRSREFDLTLYEFFQTDLYGHRRTVDESVNLIRNLDLLLNRLLSRLHPERDTLLVTSDHGNLEEGASRTHTRNPVPLIVWGSGADTLRNRIRRLDQVTPAILEWMGSGE